MGEVGERRANGQKAMDKSGRYKLDRRDSITNLRNKMENTLLVIFK